MTARPLARPPMTSRRALFFATHESISVCEEMGSPLTRGGGAVQHRRRDFVNRIRFRYAKTDEVAGGVLENRFAGATLVGDLRVQRGDDRGAWARPVR